MQHFNKHHYAAKAALSNTFYIPTLTETNQQKRYIIKEWNKRETQVAQSTDTINHSELKYIHKYIIGISIYDI